MSQPLDKAVSKFAAQVIENSGQRQIAQALELYASLDDYLQAIQEKCYDGGVFDTSVTVKVDGKTIKFPDVESMAEWLNGHGISR